MAKRVVDRRNAKEGRRHDFYVPAPEERIVFPLCRGVSALLFRLCDMIDVAVLMQAEQLIC